MTTVHSDSMRNHARASHCSARFSFRNKENDAERFFAMIRRREGVFWLPFVPPSNVTMTNATWPDVMRHDTPHQANPPMKEEALPS